MRFQRSQIVWAAALCFGLAATASYAGGRHRPGHAWHHGHPGHGLNRSPLLLFDTLDLLESDTAPLNFTAENFPSADIDSNGVLDDDEWTTFSDEKYDNLTERILHRHPDVDIDSNGILDADELDAHEAAAIERYSRMLLERNPEADIDSNGVISADELEAVRAENRAEFLERKPEADLDGDGILTAEELAAYRLAQRAGDNRPQGHRRPGHKRGHRGAFGHGRSRS